MVMCWAPGCTHYNERETCKFFRFPKDPKIRRKWLQLIRRVDEPGPGAFICSCHFQDGKKENEPKFFQHSEGKMFNFSSPEKKKAKTKKTGDSQKTEIYEETEPPIEVEVQNEPEPSCSSAVQFEAQPCSSSSISRVLLETENYFLKRDLDESEAKLSYFENKISFESIRSRENLVLLYTGLQSASDFESILELIGDLKINYYHGWTVEILNREDQLLLTLMKLRHNFPQLDLAHRFSVSQSTVSNVIITWVHLLHQVLFKNLMQKIPDRQKNRSCLPNCFSTFTNCRIIIDCTEVYTAVPRSSMSSQKATYSSYKQRNTFKGLIGVSPNGVITYISGLYAGSISDKKIVQHCGILEQLVPGDLILADKGFLIRDILPPGVELNLPPFLTTPQLTPEQVYQTETIARARIHVERAIRRMKVYKILQFIPQTLRGYATEVFQVVGALTNLQSPLIKEVEQYYTEE